MTTCYHPQRKWAFIHIPKCAGSAIGGRFETAGDKWTDCWLQKAIPGWTREGFPTGHVPVAALPLTLGHPIEWWDKILVSLRNPFAQQVSQYCFWRARGHDVVKRRAHAAHPDDRFAISTTFEQFVRDPRANGPNALCGDRWQETGGVYRWWCQVDNQIPRALRVIRVEDLPDALCDEIDAGRGIKLLDNNSLRGTYEYAPWAEWYNEESAAMVRRKFAWSLTKYYPELTDFHGSGTMTAAERGAESSVFANC